MFLVVPREPLSRDVKGGRTTQFWSTYWNKMDDSNRSHFRDLYNAKKQSAQRNISNISRRLPREDKKYYVKAQLDEEANSKGKVPSELWSQAGLRVVETRSDGSVTLSGRKQNYQTLERLFEEAQFERVSGDGVSNAEQRISREIYAVTALQDKNSSAEDRQSEDVRAWILSNAQEQMGCVLEVYFDYNIDDEEYLRLFNSLNEHFANDLIRRRDIRFFVSNMSFDATLTGVQVTALLHNEDFNFISYIKIAPHFSSQRATPNVGLDNINIGNLLTNELVVLLDSGVNNQRLNHLVSQRENLIVAHEVADERHGTSVASRLLFGNDFFQKINDGTQLLPAARLIDFKILHLQNGKYKLSRGSDQVLMDALDKVVRRYPAAHIVNMSIADETSAHGEKKEALTEFIDDLLNKNDIIIVNSVGNQTGNYAEGYEDVFSNDSLDIHIASPADALNVISVGSIALRADENSLCDQVGRPSPFTRKAKNDIKKPELVADGGNVQVCALGVYSDAHLSASANTYGSEVISVAGLARDIGTSFSAPLVTREAVLLLDYLKNSGAVDHLPRFTENKSNLVKALLIHSTERSEKVAMSKALKRAYGFGVPNQSAVTLDNENQITIVYADRIEHAQKKQQLIIDLPDFLLGNQIELIYSLTYNPPVNKNFDKYKMITLQSGISTLQPLLNDAGEVIGEDWKPVSGGGSWDSYKNPNFNTVHFKKKLRDGLQSTRLRVGVQMLVANEYEKLHIGREQNIYQNYAFVLTVRDLGGNNRLRSSLIESNQFIELTENVHIEI